MQIRKNISQPKRKINININKNIYSKTNINNNPYLINCIPSNNFLYENKIKSNRNKKIFNPRCLSQNKIKLSTSNQIKNNERHFNILVVANNININNNINENVKNGKSGIRKNNYINNLFDKKIIPKKDNFNYNRTDTSNNIGNKKYIKDNKKILDKQKEMTMDIIKQKEEENKKKKEKEEEEKRKKEEEKKIILENNLRKKEEKSENDFNMGLIPSNFFSFHNINRNNTRSNSNDRYINRSNNHNYISNTNEPIINKNYDNIINQDNNDVNNDSFNESIDNIFIDENNNSNNIFININNNNLNNNERFNNRHRGYSLLENSNEFFPYLLGRRSNNLFENNFEYEPIKDNILNKLPESKIIDIKKLNEENKRCTICLEDFKYNDIVIYLPCFHIFHKNCIINWIKKNAVCPLCKYNINNIKDQNIYYS